MLRAPVPQPRISGSRPSVPGAVLAVVAILAWANITGLRYYFGFKGYLFHWGHGWPWHFLLRRNGPLPPDGRYSSHFPFGQAEVVSWKPLAAVANGLTLVLLAATVALSFFIARRCRATGDGRGIWITRAVVFASAIVFIVAGIFGGVVTRFFDSPVFAVLLPAWSLVALAVVGFAPNTARGGLGPKRIGASPFHAIVTRAFLALLAGASVATFGWVLARGQDYIWAHPPGAGIIALVCASLWSSGRVSDCIFTYRKRVEQPVPVPRLAVAFVTCLGVWWFIWNQRNHLLLEAMPGHTLILLPIIAAAWLVVEPRDPGRYSEPRGNRMQVDARCVGLGLVLLLSGLELVFLDNDPSWLRSLFNSDSVLIALATLLVGSIGMLTDRPDLQCGKRRGTLQQKE